MTQRTPLVAILVLVFTTSTSVFAQAPEPPPSTPPPDRNPIVYVFQNLIRDARRMPTVETAVTLGVGGALALAVHPADDTVTERATAGGPRQPYRAGSAVGSGWTQIGLAVGTYTTGVISHHRAMAHFGADLVSAQAINGVITQGVKFAVRRDRPDSSGGSYSFPSGHTSSTFATAAVAWRHFGWKVGAPAAVVGAWVGASRVQLKRHFMSDVVFGAAVGTAAGRTVTIGHGTRKVTMGPTVVPGGGALTFTLAER
jgi:membrane-associated phospholipid phosphatase